MRLLYDVAMSYSNSIEDKIKRSSLMLKPERVTIVCEIREAFRLIYRCLLTNKGYAASHTASAADLNSYVRRYTIFETAKSQTDLMEFLDQYYEDMYYGRDNAEVDAERIQDMCKVLSHTLFKLREWLEDNEVEW